MMTTQNAVTVNRTTQFASWLFSLIGGERAKAAKVCLQCLLDGGYTSEGMAPYVHFIERCQSRADAFTREQECGSLFPFRGLELLVQEELTRLSIPTEQISQFRPQHKFYGERKCALISIPECTTIELIAIIEGAIGEKADLEVELKHEADKWHRLWWEERTKRAAVEAFGKYGIPSEEVLSNLEKLITHWRETRNTPGD